MQLFRKIIAESAKFLFSRTAVYYQRNSTQSFAVTSLMMIENIQLIIHKIIPYLRKKFVVIEKSPLYIKWYC